MLAKITVQCYGIMISTPERLIQPKCAPFGSTENYGTMHFFVLQNSQQRIKFSFLVHSVVVLADLPDAEVLRFDQNFTRIPHMFTGKLQYILGHSR
jgi:hypothetical protein